MKSHDVAVVETTALSGGHPSEVIRSGAGPTPRPHSHPCPVGGHRPAVVGTMPLSVTGHSTVMRTWPGRGRHRSTELDPNARRDAERVSMGLIPFAGYVQVREK